MPLILNMSVLSGAILSLLIHQPFKATSIVGCLIAICPHCLKKNINKQWKCCNLHCKWLLPTAVLLTWTKAELVKLSYQNILLLLYINLRSFQWREIFQLTMNPKSHLRKSYLKLWFPSKSSFHLIFQNYHYVSTTVIQNATFFNIMFLLGSWAYLEMLMNRSVFSVKRGWEGRISTPYPPPPPRQSLSVCALQSPP